MLLPNPSRHHPPQAPFFLFLEGMWRQERGPCIVIPVDVQLRKISIFTRLFLNSGNPSELKYRRKHERFHDHFNCFLTVYFSSPRFIFTFGTRRKPLQSLTVTHAPHLSFFSVKKKQRLGPVVRPLGCTGPPGTLRVVPLEDALAQPPAGAGKVSLHQRVICVVVGVICNNRGEGPRC